MSEEDPREGVRDRVERLHGHLEATATMALDRRANRLLGEAEAVAGDAAEPGLTAETRRERVERVAELLAAVDEANLPPTAREHLRAARSICAAVRDT